MQVLPAQMNELTGARTFNFAAPGDTPLDMLATLRFALSRGARIEHVLIGVDDQAMFGSYDESHETRAAMVPEILAQLPLKERARITLRLPAQVKPELTDEALVPRDRSTRSSTAASGVGERVDLRRWLSDLPATGCDARDKSWNPARGADEIRSRVACVRPGRADVSGWRRSASGI